MSDSRSSTTLSRSIIAAGLTLCSAISIANAHDVTWYDAALGTLPDQQCWQYIEQNGNVEPEMVDGHAHLGPTYLNGRAYWYRSLKPFVAEYGAMVAVKANVITSSYLQSGSLRRSGFAIMLTDDEGRWARLGVSNSRLVLQTTPASWGDKVIGFTADGVEHEYQLEFVNGSVNARVDGAIVLTATPGYGGDVPNSVTVGDSTMWGHSETLTSFIQVQTVSLCGPGDFNCDGKIDGIDLSALLANWGQPDCENDLDFDGELGAGDIAILLSAWTG